MGTYSCHSQAYCANTAGSYTCHCNSGYVGDGMSCLRMYLYCMFNLQHEIEAVLLRIYDMDAKLSYFFLYYINKEILEKIHLI